MTLLLCETNELLSVTEFGLTRIYLALPYMADCVQNIEKLLFLNINKF